MRRRYRKSTDKASVLTELARRIAAAKARGDHRSAELHTASWHKINGQTDRQREVAGQAHRIAAQQAAIPLDERRSEQVARICPDCGAGSAAVATHCSGCLAPLRAYL